MATSKSQHEVFQEGSGLRYGVAGGCARIAELLDEVRRERPGRVMVMDGGDTLHGT